jgi:tetratricopeptide (TPR) repeat protein
MDEFVRELLTLGRTYFSRKQFQRAEKYLTQVVEQNQSFADVYNMLGVIYHDQGQYARAQRSFEAALKLNPAYTEAALNLAIIYNDIGKYQEAKEVYQSTLQRTARVPGELDHFVKGKIANMYAEIADVYASSGFFEEAVVEYNRALAMCPGFPDIRVKLGAALRDKGDKEAALREFSRSVADAPHFLPARIQLGVALYSLGRLDEALKEWEEVLRRNPGDKKAEMYLALVRESPKTS